MAAQSPDDLESALRQAFFAAVPAAVNNTALENQKFDPSGKSPHYEFRFQPNTPEVATLGSGGTDRFDGLALVSIFVPLGKGKEGVQAFETALRSAFTAGARFNYSSASVIIKSCGRYGNGNAADGFYRFPFVITWESRLRRN